MAEWTPDLLLEHFTALRKSDKEAVDAALAAAQQAVNAALAAAEKAVDKAERAAAAKFEAVNEFRAQLSDQAATFMPRTEAEIRLGSLSDRLDQLDRGSSISQGRSAGLNAGWLFLLGAAGLILTVLSIAGVVVGLSK